MSAGGSPAPMRATDIVLAREDLRVRVTRTHAEVTATLSLHNPGPAAKLYVGFPCDRVVDPGISGLDCRTKVGVKVAGKRVSPRRETTAAKKTFWMWPLRLPAEGDLEVVVTYASRLRNDRYETPFLGMGTIYYRLVTGASWAGPIGELSMEVDMPTDLLVHVAPPGYVRTHGQITWHFRDYEPTQDVAILVHPMYLGRADSVLPAATPEALREAIERGGGDRAGLSKLAGELRDAKTIDELLAYAAFFQEAARKRLGLPDPKPDEVRACVEESARLLESAAKGPAAPPK